jgi:hypothetical protein
MAPNRLRLLVLPETLAEPVFHFPHQSGRLILARRAAVEADRMRQRLGPAVLVELAAVAAVAAELRKTALRLALVALAAMAMPSLSSFSNPSAGGLLRNLHSNSNQQGE